MSAALLSDTGSIAARCSCGATYTLAQFRALPDAGVQYVEPGTCLELRGCPCASHLSLWIDERSRPIPPPAWAVPVPPACERCGSISSNRVCDQCHDEHYRQIEKE